MTKWTVREASIVTVGSNHNAIAFYDRKTGKQIDLSDIQTSILKQKKADATNHSELAELTKMDWSQIDKSGKLSLLKTKYYSLYKSKFAEKFGNKPNNL